MDDVEPLLRQHTRLLRSLAQASAASTKNDDTENQLTKRERLTLAFMEELAKRKAFNPARKKDDMWHISLLSQAIWFTDKMIEASNKPPGKRKRD